MADNNVALRGYGNLVCNGPYEICCEPDDAEIRNIIEKYELYIEEPKKRTPSTGRHSGKSSYDDLHDGSESKEKVDL